jgi:hypothetical protein
MAQVDLMPDEIGVTLWALALLQDHLSDIPDDDAEEPYELSESATHKLQSALLTSSE